MARRGLFGWLKSKLSRKPPPAPPAPPPAPPGKHESGVPVSDILGRLRRESEAPPPEPSPPDRRVVLPGSRGDVASYVADSRPRLDIRDSDYELSDADIDSLIRSLGVNNAVTLAREQNESIRAYEDRRTPGLSEPGHTRYANQVERLERMLGRRLSNLASHRSSKLTFSQDYVQWFWYHGKKL